MEYILSASIACVKSKGAFLRPTQTHSVMALKKHYLSHIYRIPHQWGIWVNTKLCSSEKSAAVPAMHWWNYTLLVLWGFEGIRLRLHTGTPYWEKQTTALLVWLFELTRRVMELNFLWCLFWEDFTEHTTEKCNKILFVLLLFGKHIVLVRKYTILDLQ